MDKELEVFCDALIYVVENKDLEQMSNKNFDSLLDKMSAMRVILYFEDKERSKLFLPYYEKVFKVALKRLPVLPKISLLADEEGRIIFGKEELIWLFSSMPFEKMMETLENILKQVSSRLSKPIIEVAMSCVMHGDC